MHSRLLATVCVSMALGINAAASADQLIRNVNVVDVAVGRVAVGQDILIENGSIVRVAATPLEPDGAAVFDAKGAFAIPGLWDSHVHIFSSSQEPAAAFPLYLINGVTGIRDMGGLLPLDEMKRIAVAVESGDLLGPRIILSGAWVDASPGSWPGMFLADTEEQARSVVRQVKDQGWAAVKSYSMLREEVYLALAREAETRGLPLVGHVPESVTLPIAIAAGHDAIEHFGRITKACSTEEAAMIAGVKEALLADDPRTAMIEEMTGHNQIVLDTWDRALCDRILDSLLTGNVHVVPTLIVADFYTGKRPLDLAARMDLLPPEVRDSWSRPDFRLEAMTDDLKAIAAESIALDLRTFRMGHVAGIPMLAGSDASFANPFVFHGFSLLDELDRYVEAGLTARQALYTATVAPAEFLGLAEENGRLAPGMRADLIILKRNPLDGLGTLRRPVAVVVHGRLLDDNALQAMRQMRTTSPEGS